MIFVTIDGPLDDLRDLAGLPELHLQRGVRDLGAGQWRATGVVQDTSALDAIRAKGLTVTITMDEDEVKRRVAADQSMMKPASGEAAAAPAASQSKDDKSNGSRKP
jgi:hypothetical protein